MKKLGLSIIIVLYTLSISGQTKVGLASLIPPAPNAAEIGKYGSIPVGTLTGVPEISFMLYEVNSGSLKLPISLSYHASGIQVNQKSTDVGLGWSIMAGGTISRTIFGAADNTANGYFNYPPPSWNTLFNTNNYYTMSTYKISGGTGYDLEPDLFAYNMGGKSGKFIFKPGQGFTTIPFDPIKIQTDGTGLTMAFQLVDDNGIIYKFGQYSQTSSDFGAQSSHISSWHLTSIISPDFIDTITLFYDTVFHQDPMVQQVHPIGKKITWNGTTAAEEFVVGDQYGNVQTIESINAYTELVLKKIVFNNGFVQFNRNTVRKDNSPSTKMLDEIVVYNQSSQVIKKISLNHDYFTVTPFVNDWIHHRLKLTGFVESDSVLSDKKVYGFCYETGSLPVFGSFGIDYWGYYNGASNLTLIPQTTVTAGEINTVSFANGESYSNGFVNPSESWIVGNANREPSETYMKTAMLNKVSYPTGGYTVFEYEPHKYTSTLNPTSPITKIGGGLRVKSIKSYSENNVLSKEELYTYGENENGIGIKLFEEKNFYRNYEDVVFAYYTGGMCYPVSGYQTRWQRNYLGISKYNSLNYMGSPVLYSRVVKYEGNSISNIGKTVYRYNVIQDTPNFPDEFINSGNYGSINNAWRQGELISDSVFRKEGSNYYPVSFTTNEYSQFNIKIDTGISLKQHKQFVPLDGCGTSDSGPEPSNPKYGQGFFVMYGYFVKTGAIRMTKKTNTVFDLDDPSKYISTSTNYQYQNSANRYLTGTSITTSDGSLKITRIMYPQDTSGTVMSAMISKNILTPVMEEKVFKSIAGSETLMSTVKTNYFQAGNLILKSNLSSSTRNLTPEIRVSFNQYDMYGNILEQQKADDAKQSYIWDYKSNYLIAEVTNAPVSDIAYTSFESEGKGNWSFSGLAIGDLTTPSGKMAYNLSGGTITKSTNSTTVYILSYWRPSSLSALSISGTQSGYPTAGRVVNGWRYFEHKVTGVNAATVSGTGLIDEVRLYPFQAQMTTYTYEPLIGVTAVCDLVNRFTYYEYDGLQRLTLVRDQDKNILKKISYKYHGQVENCSLVGNSPQSGPFTRNNCSVGYIGTTVNYMVSQNTYYAATQQEADQMAAADVASNGQSYANQVGTCIVICNTSNCTGVSNKCVNGLCEAGIKIYTSSVQTGPHLYECAYHYEWSDGSWSQNFTEQSPTECSTMIEM